MLEEDIISLGFTSGEAKAYLALLKTGTSTVGPISKKSGISYSKIYEVLNRLTKKGVVSSITKQKTKYYQAIEPSRIVEFLNKQEKDLAEKKKTFNNIFPQLKKMLESSSKQEVEVFTGIQGLKTAYDLLIKDIKKDKTIYFMYVFDKENQITIDKFYGSLPYYSGFKWKGITSSEYSMTTFTKKMHKMIETRTVNFPLPASIDIGEDKVLQVAWSGNPVGILIHSKEIASNYRAYFDKIWDKGKKFS